MDVIKGGVSMVVEELVEDTDKAKGTRLALDGKLGCGEQWKPIN